MTLRLKCPQLKARLSFKQREIVMKMIVALSALFILAAPGHAEWDEGIAAYDAGDYAAAFTEFRPLAQQGDARAQTKLGILYQIGEGVERNQKEALKWYRRAAKQGDANAQYELGNASARVNRMRQENREAEKWYRRAAGQGHAGAMCGLGIMYNNSEGVSQSDIVAYALFNLAAVDGWNDVPQKGLEDMINKMNAAEIEAGQDLSMEMFKPGNFLAALDGYLSRQ
jgi:uncharacterized protein